jgi:dUTP pyrophosphatase
MKISIIRSVKTPNRAHDFDSGIDFYVPEINEQFLIDLKKKNPNTNYQINTIDGIKYIILNSHTNILIPSGVKANVPKGIAMNFDNKSGIASKHGLIVGAKAIDHGYQGEIHINLINTSHNIVRIHEGQKIIQAILYVISNDKVKIVDCDELYDEKSERGEGGFGHSDNK